MKANRKHFDWRTSSVFDQLTTENDTRVAYSNHGKMRIWLKAYDYMQCPIISWCGMKSFLFFFQNSSCARYYNILKRCAVRENANWLRLLANGDPPTAADGKLGVYTPVIKCCRVIFQLFLISVESWTTSQCPFWMKRYVHHLLTCTQYHKMNAVR